MTDWTPVPEADKELSEAGAYPTSEGWYVTNVADALAVRQPGQHTVPFEAPGAWFADYGFNVRFLEPGVPNCRYHREGAQESIFVLSGRPLLVVEEQERELRPWDFVHLPAGTAHVLVGAGDEPCVVIMVGARKDPEHLLYPVSGAAQRHGASVARETTDGDIAYADYPEPDHAQVPGHLIPRT